MVTRQVQPGASLDLGKGKALLFLPNVRFIGPGASLLPSAVVVRQFSGVRCVCTEEGGERRPSGWRLHAGDGLDFEQITPTPKFRSSDATRAQFQRFKHFLALRPSDRPSCKPTRLRLRCELEGQPAASEIGIGQQSSRVMKRLRLIRPTDRSMGRRKAYAGTMHGRFLRRSD